MFTIFEEVREYLWRYDCQNIDTTVDPVKLLRDVVTIEDHLATTITEENETLKGENSTLKERIRELDLRIQSMRVDYDKQEELLSDCQTENMALKELRDEALEDHVKEELEGLREECDRLSMELSACQFDNIRLKEDLEELRSTHSSSTHNE